MNQTVVLVTFRGITSETKSLQITYRLMFQIGDWIRELPGLTGPIFESHNVVGTQIHINSTTLTGNDAMSSILSRKSSSGIQNHGGGDCLTLIGKLIQLPFTILQ